ncbi:transcriptional regulator [Nitrosopumilus sp.]|uniref:transcriptional regulator n=1 Tax=Nitrosopumilus sp. TaxID=2024843 RepID=UPI00292D3666|nr:transcriptional regulator [Nitrosopumilus sp.]
MFDRFKKQNKEIVEEFKNIDEKESQNLKKPDKLENENRIDKVDPASELRESESEKPADVFLSASSCEIGIGELMGKRAKLEEAIDYVGLMIKNLKDKRTLLEKDIEEESVDIKNLKEKLQKIGEYIKEKNKGIKELVNKRIHVESEADEVGLIINNLRGKLSGIDSIIDGEGDRVKKVKESRESPET